VAEDPWQRQIEAFGEYVRAQRKLAKLSLRELAARAEISNAYLSQLERGLHAPSVRVLKNLADAFEVSAETILGQAGLLDDEEGAGEERPGTEQVIMQDARLTDAQKEALLAVYRGFVGDAATAAGGPGTE
jgi:transcriptional regulator with XRE-family HTH domain